MCFDPRSLSSEDIFSSTDLTHSDRGIGSIMISSYPTNNPIGIRVSNELTTILRSFSAEGAL